MCRVWKYYEKYTHKKNVYPWFSNILTQLFTSDLSKENSLGGFLHSPLWQSFSFYTNSDNYPSSQTFVCEQYKPQILELHYEKMHNILRLNSKLKRFILECFNFMIKWLKNWSNLTRADPNEIDSVDLSSFRLSQIRRNNKYKKQIVTK